MNITLSLGPIDRADLDQIRKWRNDHRIWQWCRQNDVISDVDHESWFERQSNDPATRMYKIQRTIGNCAPESLGVCGLTSLDLLNRRAEFSLYIAPEHQGRGVGRRSLAMLLAHGFANYGLNVIWGETFSGNPACKMFEALGLEKEGTRRQFYMREGRFIDAHLYSITREKWIKSQSSPEPASSEPSPQPSEPPSPAPSTPGSPGETIDATAAIPIQARRLGKSRSPLPTES